MSQVLVKSKLILHWVSFLSEWPPRSLPALEVQGHYAHKGEKVPLVVIATILSFP